MRIAQIMLGRGFGGAERSFVDIAAALAERGHEILALADPRGRAYAQLAAGKRDGITLAGVVCRGNWDLLARWRIRRRLADFAPAVVHTHLARAAHHGGAAAAALLLPSVAKTHNLVNPRYYRHISCLVPTTAAQEHHLRDCGIDAARLERIPNFTRIGDSAVGDPGLQRRSPAPPYALRALGRFVHKKGFDTLVDAVGALHQQGVEVRLQLAGDGPEAASLRQQIAHLGLGDVIELVGWIDDAAGFLRGADLLVVPSRDEPFGIVLIEAMAAGVPVLATRTQGPLEILTPGTGFLVEANDPALLAHAIAEALAGHGWMTVAQAARQRFEACYSEAQVVARYLALYQRLCA